MNSKDLMNAFLMLVANAAPTEVSKDKANRMIDSRLTRGKTRPGAKHKVGEAFKSVKYLMLTPAQYRHTHFARTIKGVPANGYPRYY